MANVKIELFYPEKQYLYQIVFIITDLMIQSILITAATQTELNCLDFLKDMTTDASDEDYRGIKILRLVTGIGSVSTVWSLMDFLKRGIKPSISINLGIAGSYKEKYNVGSVLVPASDCFADMGIESSHPFKTIWETGLIDPDKFPFKKARVSASPELINIAHEIFPLVQGITVNTCTGTSLTKELWKSKFNPDIETMEGAGFYYVCQRENIPSVAIRSVSNMVEERNREGWNIELALEKLGSSSELLLKKIIEQWN